MAHGYNVWTSYSEGFPINCNPWKVYACRLEKRLKSSTRCDDVAPEKRRKTTIRQPKLCHAKIRVTTLVSSGMVRIEPYKNSTDHTHTIEESDALKVSQALRKAVIPEAAKLSSPANRLCRQRARTREIGRG